MRNWWTSPESPLSLADGELLNRYVAGQEPQAFQALVARHQPRVLRVCRRVLGDEHRAEDVCQETFVVLARKAGELPWQRSIGPWLTSVARRLALNALVRAKRRQHDVLEEEVTGRAADPLALAAHHELQSAIGTELGALPEKYRDPVVLCYLEGKTNVEAARELGWPTGSMSRRLDRARALLQERLTARGFGLWLLLAAGAAALGWLNSSSTNTRPVERARLAHVCHAEHGPHVLAVLESVARADKLAPTRQAVAALATGIAADAAQLPELAEAAHTLAADALTPDAGLTIPASRVLLLCANCHVSR